MTALYALAFVLAVGIVVFADVMHRRYESMAAAEQRRDANTLKLFDDFNRAHAATLAVVVEQHRNEQKQTLEVLNRFLSRTFEEHQYARMVADQVVHEQDDDPDDETRITREAVAQHLKEIEDRMREEPRAGASQGGG